MVINMSKKVKILIAIVLIVIVVVVLFFTFRSGDGEKLNNNQTVNNSAINESNDENNTSNNISNNTVNNTSNNENKVENKSTETVSNLVEQGAVYKNNSEVGTTDKKQQAIDLVKIKWGEDSTVSFSCDSVEENGEYIIAVTSLETATVRNYFRVNLETKEVTIEF